MYQMLTMENEDPSRSIPAVLQRFFYKLQYSEIRVSTKLLVQSLGWDSDSFFSMNDAQDLNRVLFDELEKRMKGKEVETTMKQLFVGHQMNYIECIHVDCKSTMKQSFIDFQLEVKDCEDVYDSFDKYVEVEKLEGEYKCKTLEHGLQDAKKGILFIEFPTVLKLHLRTFEYDFSHTTFVKLNDNYEFPLQLDLDRDNGRYLSPEAYRSLCNVYTLHSVLVHNGSRERGHYYSYIRPTLTDQWYKFNDEVVMKVETSKAFEELCGSVKTEAFTTAYMLVMCNVDENDIIEDFRVRLQKKREEKQRKIKKNYEAEIYTTIKVATDDDLKNQIGKDINFGLVDHTRLRSYQVQKQNYFIQFKDVISKEHNITVHDFRFWLCNRFNRTYAPYRAINESEEHESVGYLQQNFGHDSDLRLFLELNQNKDAVILPLPERTTDEIVLFFKMYDPYQEQLRYVGRYYVQKSRTLREIIPKLNEMANFPAEQELCLCKETPSNEDEICHYINIYATAETSQLHDADIICFQKYLTLEQIESLRFPTVKNFLEYLHNEKIVHFRKLQSPDKDEFFLELSREHTYKEVVEKVAVKLGMMDGASKIRLTCHNYYSKKPFLTSIDFSESRCLREMLPQCNQPLYILYFEIIDSPLPQRYCMKNLEVAIHNQKTKKISVQSVLLPEESTIADVITVLKDQVSLFSTKEKLLVLEISSCKIKKIFHQSVKIQNINNNSSTLRAEEIPEEAKYSSSEHVMMIQVCHFRLDNLEKVITFGDPFLLVIQKTETMAEVKARIKRKLEVSDEDFGKWNFQVLCDVPVYCIQNTDIVFESFMGTELSEVLLGIQHTESDTTSPSKQRQNSHGKAIKIND